MADWVFTVSEVGEFVKRTFDNQPLLQNLQVRGEISDLRRSAAGHVYFALKDERALLRCVYFRQDQRYGQKLSDGQKVTVTGRLSFYAEQGQINYYVKQIKNDGIGDLFLLFEQRRERFRQLGYFDPDHKRDIPTSPERIGVVTSPTGSVIRDIIRVINRRNPRTQIVLYPARVQGDGAAEEIAAGIRAFNGLNSVDLLIVGRGGGSFEDLWEFNDEVVVQAVYQSKLPVISAVGHETDFTLCDFAADVRAATPSEAAELAVPDGQHRLRQIEQLEQRLSGVITGLLHRTDDRLHMAERILSIHNPLGLTADGLLRVDHLSERMQGAMDRRLQQVETQVTHIESRLNDMNPAWVLKRGYAAIYSHAKARYVISANQLASEDQVMIRMSDGTRNAVITSSEDK